MVYLLLACVCVCAETAALEAVPQGPFDVAISATSEDGALAEFIKGEGKLWFFFFHLSVSEYMHNV